MREFNRRALLGGAAAALMASALPAAARPRRRFFQRIGKPIGIQTYTLGPDAGNDIDATFAELARIGFRDIELPGLMGKTPAALAAAAARAGLVISSLHVPMSAAMGGPGGLTFAAEDAALADSLGALGARWAVAPLQLMPDGVRPGPGESFGAALARASAAAGADLWKRSADLLNRKGDALKRAGIRVGYHNHNIEFAPVDGTTGWALLVAETDPALVHFEVDLGWVTAAGLDPAAFLRQHAGRVKLLHVKDVAAGNRANFALEMKPTEVGSGMQPWAAILATAARIGVEHYFLEQEPPFTMPRMAAAAKGFAFLAQLRA